MVRSKRKKGQQGEQGDVDKKRIDTLLLHPTPTSVEGNFSKQGLCFQTQIQQNVRCCHETSKWAILTSDGLQMQEEQREQKVPAGC